MAIKITGEEAVERKPLLSLASSGEAEHTQGYAEEQAAKLHLALEADSPGIDEISRSMSTGNSVYYKELLAQKDLMAKQTAQRDVLSSIQSMDPSAITPEVVEVVQGLSVSELRAPDLGHVIERKYSQLYTNLAAAELENDILEDAMAADEEASLDLMDRAEWAVHKRNVISEEASKLQKRMEDRSLAGKVWDFTERVIPFVDWYQKHDAVGSDFTTSILPGSNVQEQYAYLWNLPPERFETEFTAALNEMADRNPDTAMSWLQGAISYGSSDGVIDNILGVVDVVDTALIPLGVLKGALKGVVRGGAKNPLKTHEIAADVGKFEDAAVGKIVEELKDGTFVGGDIRNLKALEDSVPSLSAPNSLLVGSRNVPQAAYLRMKETLAKNSDLARRFLTEPNLTDRATPDELVQYRDVLRDSYLRDNPSIQKSVIDVRVAQTGDLGNVYQAEVILGRRDGTLFESAKQAENFVKKWIKNADAIVRPAEGVVSRTVPTSQGKKLEAFAIEQIGQGFQVVIPKTVDESQFARSIVLQTTQETPQSLANTFLGAIRSPDYTVSGQQTVARSQAVTSTERLREIYEELARPLTTLPKREYDELEPLLVSNRESHTFYENYGAFEDAFFSRYKKNPSIEQTEAYFTYVQMNDLDLVVRDLDWYKQKAAQGREEITLRVGDEDLVFEGKVVEDLPVAQAGGDNDFRWRILDGTTKKSRSSASINPTDREKIAKLKEQGYKIIQVADQSLNLGKNDYVGFVITKDARRSRVGVKNVDRKAGGHKVDTYQGYLKQPRVSKADDGSSAYYRGDTTLLGVTSRADGEDAARLFETARLKLLNNEPDAMKFIRDNLPIDTRRFMAAVADGTIDITQPFVYTPKGSRVTDTGALSNIQNLRDGTKSIYNLDSQIMGRYGGQRDHSAIDVIRSEGDMKFEISGAEYLDPLSTLRMSAANMISQRMMNDYTLMTNRNFLREFGDILEGDAQEQLSSGISLLMEPRFKSGVDPRRQAAATNVSRAYRMLMNNGTALDRKVNLYKEKLLQSIRPSLPKGAQTWVDERMISGVKDPGVFFRSAAFHMKLGLFNVQQIFIQSNAMVNVVAVGGADGLRGGFSYPVFRAAMLSSEPAVHKRAGKILENLGVMKGEEFEESLSLYKRSGFHAVGRDHAFLDDVTGPVIRERPVRGALSKTLSWGMTPFQEGERVVRMAAWQTAYLETKKRVGQRALNRREQAQVLSRAKDLAVNMSRESNAAWQKGYGAVFSQFMSFQARLTEQFLGKKLTSAEKTRLFLGYSAMYGAPVGVGAATGVIPVRDIVLDTLYENGVDVNDTALEPFIDGFASTLLEQIGVGEFNIADRYGAGGLANFYDVLFGDEPTWELFTGASGSIFMETMMSAVPIIRGAASEYLDFEGGIYNLTKEDMVGPLRQVSTIDNAWKLYQVYNLGIWASKNDVALIEMDLPQGVAAAITGLTPGELEDSFRRIQAMSGWRESKEAAVKDFETQYRRILRMDPGPEREKMIRNIKAQMRLAGLSEREKWQSWSRGARETTLRDSVIESWERELGRKTRREDMINRTQQ